MKFLCLKFSKNCNEQIVRMGQKKYHQQPKKGYGGLEDLTHYFYITPLSDISSIYISQAIYHKHKFSDTKIYKLTGTKTTKFKGACIGITKT